MDRQDPTLSMADLDDLPLEQGPQASGFAFEAIHGEHSALGLEGLDDLVPERRDDADPTLDVRSLDELFVTGPGTESLPTNASIGADASPWVTSVMDDAILAISLERVDPVSMQDSPHESCSPNHPVANTERVDDEPGRLVLKDETLPPSSEIQRAAAEFQRFAEEFHAFAASVGDYDTIVKTSGTSRPGLR
jgi:hypothetical protein